MTITQLKPLEFDVSFNGINSNRQYSLPVSIECEGSIHYEIIDIIAQTTSLGFTIRPILPYSEAYLIIQGDHYIDQHNTNVTVLAVPHGFNFN